jgi:hypothetical protein
MPHPDDIDLGSGNSAREIKQVRVRIRSGNHACKRGDFLREGRLAQHRSGQAMPARIARAGPCWRGHWPYSRRACVRSSRGPLTRAVGESFFPMRRF